jgi:hypothetical protein
MDRGACVGQRGIDTTMNTSAAWRRQQYLEERGRELELLEREAQRDARKLLVQTLGGCVACCTLGLIPVLWSMHSTDLDLAPVAFWGGLTFGDTGMLVLLLRHYARTDAAGL